MTRPQRKKLLAAIKKKIINKVKLTEIEIQILKDYIDGQECR